MATLPVPDRRGIPGKAHRFGRVLWTVLACVTWGLTVTSGCHPAATLEQGALIAENRFSMTCPDAETWRLVTNRARGKWSRVVFRHHGSDAWVVIVTQPEPEQVRDVPLDVLAVRMFAGTRDVLPAPVQMEAGYRIALDDRECMAILGTRPDRPVPWRQAFLLVRSQGYLITLSFLALEPIFPVLEPEFGAMVQSFRVLLPGPFDRWALGDIPVGPPGKAPRNIFAPSPSPAPLLKSPGGDLRF